MSSLILHIILLANNFLHSAVISVLNCKQMKTNLGLELILQPVGAHLYNTGDRGSDINYRKRAELNTLHSEPSVVWQESTCIQQAKTPEFAAAHILRSSFRRISPTLDFILLFLLSPFFPATFVPRDE